MFFSFFPEFNQTNHAFLYIYNYVTSTVHKLKWDDFAIDILAEGRTDTHCKIKETIN